MFFDKTIFKRIIFMFLLFLSVYFYRNYFQYNDHIEYFDVDISNNVNLVDIIKKNGVQKDPQRNFNNSSCHVLSYYDISDHCHEYIDKFYNKEFIQRIKTIINETNLEFIDPAIDPLGFAIHLYCKEDFMSYHFDTNFTLGTRYSIIIPLYINQENDCFLYIKDSKKIEKKIEIPVGKGIVYNGDKVLHKVCKQSPEGERITLVINLTTKTQTNFIGKILQKCRNYMFSEFTW
jgi:hypothetical protein